MNSSHDLRGLRAALCTAVLAAGLSVAGCGAPQAPRIAKTAAPSTAPSGTDGNGTAAAAHLETQQEHAAQRAWCQYLQALYVRATNSPTGWPRFRECTRATTTAAPEMLRRTAKCSMAALATFEGDPLTPAYAAEVRRCGAEALDAAAASTGEVDALVMTMCERAQACGETNGVDCRARMLSAENGRRLGRALGAISRKGQGALRACVSRAPCAELDVLVEKCLEPIMGQLLWLPE